MDNPAREQLGEEPSNLGLNIKNYSRLTGAQTPTTLRDKSPLDISLDTLSESLGFTFDRVLVLRERLNRVIIPRPQNPTEGTANKLEEARSLSEVIARKANKAKAIGDMVDDIINSLEL